jgi:hypothetical protein
MALTAGFFVGLVGHWFQIVVTIMVVMIITIFFRSASIPVSFSVMIVIGKSIKN